MNSRARTTAQQLANTSNKPTYLYTDPSGEYVICFVLKSESFEGEALTLVEIFQPEFAA